MFTWRCGADGWQQRAMLETESQRGGSGDGDGAVKWSGCRWSSHQAREAVDAPRSLTGTRAGKDSRRRRVQ